MPTIAHCQIRARELTALAEAEPEHKSEYLVDAVAWLRLARSLAHLADDCYPPRPIKSG